MRTAKTPRRKGPFAFLGVLGVHPENARLFHRLSTTARVGMIEFSTILVGVFRERFGWADGRREGFMAVPFFPGLDRATPQIDDSGATLR
jgi:hypothetical protein